MNIRPTGPVALQAHPPNKEKKRIRLERIGKRIKHRRVIATNGQSRIAKLTLGPINRAVAGASLAHPDQLGVRDVHEVHVGVLLLGAEGRPLGEGDKHYPTNGLGADPDHLVEDGMSTGVRVLDVPRRIGVEHTLRTIPPPPERSAGLVPVHAHKVDVLVRLVGGFDRSSS